MNTTISLKDFLKAGLMVTAANTLVYLLCCGSTIPIENKALPYSKLVPIAKLFKLKEWRTDQLSYTVKSHR
jgi:hypothetical protein